MENNTTSSTTRTIAERILAETFGGSVRLDAGSDLGGSKRSKVLRFSILEGPAMVPASVIVKQANAPAFDPNTSNEPAWLFFNDWASMEFLGQIKTPVPLAPAFYGGNRAAGLFIMEDFGQGTRLDHLLLGNDPIAAEAGLLAYAALHGRLHAHTMGKQAQYLCIREALGPSASMPADYYNYTWLAPTLHTMEEMLNIPVEQGVDEELASLADSLVVPGPFLTFIQADAAPDNCIVRGANWRMFDFEGGHYTHALLEGVYCRMPFPTCWCVYRLPETIMQRAEATYRAELVQGCPAAADDILFYHAVVEACITWALNFHFMRPLEKMLEQDRHLVALTDRQRYLLYLNSAVHASQEFEHLQATGATLRAIASKLSRLWSEANDPPYYPAFR